MKSVVEVLKEKVEKHEEKLKAHRQSEVILQAEYNHNKEINPEKTEIISRKLFSTVTNIEYHKATAKAYNKAIALIEEKL